MKDKLLESQSLELGDMKLSSMPIEDIKVGMRASYTKIVTDKDIKEFAAVSGDRNPIHIDPIYAEKSRYRKRIAHGLMTASYFSALFGTKLPGEGCVYVSQNLRFKRPVYIGDAVTAMIEVTAVNVKERKVVFKTMCQVGARTVTEGEAEIYIPKLK